MNINYYSKNYEIGDEVKGYIEERLVKFEKHAKDADNIIINVKLEKTKHQNDEDAFNMSVELEIDGNGYFADKSSSTVFQVFDECEEAINAIIRKGKDKDVSEKRRNGGIKDIEVGSEY